MVTEVLPGIVAPVVVMTIMEEFGIAMGARLLPATEENPVMVVVRIFAERSEQLSFQESEESVE